MVTDCWKRLTLQESLDENSKWTVCYHWSYFFWSHILIDWWLTHSIEWIIHVEFSDEPGLKIFRTILLQKLEEVKVVDAIKTQLFLFYIQTLS